MCCLLRNLRTLNQILYVNVSTKGNSVFKNWSRCVSYVQGQSPEPNIREYFYYVDHQGMLFLDDSRMKNFTSCFKDKKFLEFFFKRLRMNTTGRYTEDFPYLSLCGRERNYVRCDDYPIVFTHVMKDAQMNNVLSYGHAGNLLTVKFEPEKVIMLPETGRVYHPAPERVGGIGLIRSKLAIELSKFFIFENGEQQEPTHLSWDGKIYELITDWYKEAKQQELECSN
ncbi:UPF0598 protein CG30010 [Schistocerca piceifrons]|uniref:UPF0598 protein CG30010 n=1 Tax=Schistocerca piceifrons TaxID=274613 RepID=UPI001F5E5C48|nr:UPF0598 protein CG30010 [Schistocerca piceifrons]XP_047107960.1 UPF0598 protein CG30010 [Schistocerca piceifrons]